MTIYGRSKELASRCVECNLAEPESLASLGGSAPGLVDGILSAIDSAQVSSSHQYLVWLHGCTEKTLLGADLVVSALPNTVSWRQDGDILRLGLHLVSLHLCS